MTEEAPKKRGRPAAPKSVPVLLRKATWDMDGQRHEAGETVDLPVDVAKRLIALGKAQRNDPFPGE
jgi:hypothetical protein